MEENTSYKKYKVQVINKNEEEDYKLILRNEDDPTEKNKLKGLKGTDTLATMVKVIQDRKNLKPENIFYLKFQDGREFYEHQPDEPADESSHTTLAEFFNDPDGAEIVYTGNYCGSIWRIQKSKDIFLGNATNETYEIKVCYKSVNKVESSKDNENMVKLSGGGNKASVEKKSHRKVSYDERTLIPEFQEEKFRLNPHVDGFTQQFALNIGHLDGKVTVLVYKYGCVSNNTMTACEDHVKDCKILTQFNVEPEENWILYHGGKGEVVHGKAKPKMFGKYETWITNDKQIRDPHACLAKDQVCKVCKDPAQDDGPWKNKPDCKPHMSLNTDEACEVCGYQVGKIMATELMVKAAISALTALQIVGILF